MHQLSGGLMRGDVAAPFSEVSESAKSPERIFGVFPKNSITRRGVVE